MTKKESSPINLLWNERENSSPINLLWNERENSSPINLLWNESYFSCHSNPHGILRENNKESFLILSIMRSHNSKCLWSVSQPKNFYLIQTHHISTDMYFNNPLEITIQRILCSYRNILYHTQMVLQKLYANYTRMWGFPLAFTQTSL